ELQVRRRQQCCEWLRFLSNFLAVGETDTDLTAGDFVARVWDMTIHSFFSRQGRTVIEAGEEIRARQVAGEKALAAPGGANPANPADVAPLAQEFFALLARMPFAQIAEMSAAEWSAPECTRLLGIDRLVMFEEPALHAFAAAAAVTPQAMDYAAGRLLID